MPTKMIKSFKRGANLRTLTNQQQMFVKELLADPSFNLTKAAREAGFKSPRVAGQKLIKHPSIAHHIGNEIRKRSERLEFSADEVLARLRTILEVDISDIYDDDGFTTMKEVKQLPEHIRQCITKVKSHRKTVINEDGDRETINVIEVEWMSKDNALNMAMRHFGLMEPELQINVVSPELKAKVLVDLMGSLQDGKESEPAVIDATVIDRIASSPATVGVDDE